MFLELLIRHILKIIDLPVIVLRGDQLITTQHYYRQINNLQDMPDDEFQKHIKKKLSVHLKKLFKAILTNE